MFMIVIAGKIVVNVKEIPAISFERRSEPKDFVASQLEEHHSSHIRTMIQPALTYFSFVHYYYLFLYCGYCHRFGVTCMKCSVKHPVI